MSTCNRLYLATLGLELECADFQPASRRMDGLPVVLLHEGLGCVAMWRGFGQALADACGVSVLAYSREGYGASSALRAPRTMRFMHEEALVVLPAVLQARGIEECILLGHSDGGSIALLAAASLPQVRAVISLAAHVFVETITTASIAQARAQYEDSSSGLRERLARYHRDVDGAFMGWASIWLQPDFAQWAIHQDIRQSHVPVLAMQGEQDHYGSAEQLRVIGQAIGQAQTQLIPECRHSPHLEQSAIVLTAAQQFCAAFSTTPKV